MKCRVCGGDEAVSLGPYAPYVDYETVLWDCLECGSRFAPWDGSVYEKLHTSERSVYGGHFRLAEEARRLFRLRRVEELRELLITNPKNRFVIEAIEAEGEVRKILEIGCGRGYLTSYFIARGHDILGVDISPSAVGWAKEAFGDHFAPIGSQRAGSSASYDVVYHVGTIGCVESPLEMTEDLLRCVRRGGLLLFNAPNAYECRRSGKMWIAGSQPPDLVTLFSPSIWEERFSALARVEVTVRKASPGEAAATLSERLTGRARRRTGGFLFRNGEEQPPAGERKGPGRMANLAAPAAAAVYRALPWLRPPARHGIHVRMVRK